MRTLSKPRMMALFSVWFVLALVVWLAWFLFGPGNRSWANAIDAGVIAVATVVVVAVSTLLSTRIWPATPSRADAPQNSDPAHPGLMLETGGRKTMVQPRLALSRTERAALAGGSAWMVSVLFLSLPSLISVMLHGLFGSDRLPESLDLVVAWTITLTGMVGAATTLAAVVVAVIATLQNKVPRTAKVVMWAIVSLSILACVYSAGVRP
jgi:hypothetical protein